MGVGLPPLEFTECMYDSPSFRENLHKHEKELENTSQQIKRLIKEVKDLILAAKQLSNAQRTFSKSLQSFSFECIGDSQTDDEVIISSSLREFGKLIAAIEEERDRMLKTAYDQVVVPLELFRKKHIGGVKEGKKKFDKQTAKFCQSQERYLNLSTKKQDNVLQEADASLDMAERHFYQASMEYVFLLQEVQERKKFEFVETLLSFMFGWLTFYHQGHEVAEDYRKYMHDLQFRIQKTRENFDETRNQTESLKKKMLEVRQQAHDEPGRSNKGNTREGYLFLQEKKAFGTTWIKHYCTYDKSRKDFTMLPYNQLTSKAVPPADKMVLTTCIRRMSESIEKRFCFDIQVEGRPNIIYTFQALSEDDRKAWMDIMDGREPTYTNSGKILKTEERILDDIGINFVNRCIEVLENRGLEEQGLYRVVGVTSKVNKLLAMGLDRRKSDRLANLEDPMEWETKTITSALKNYLRNLPEPLMTFRYHNGFIAAAKLELRQIRVNDVHTLIHRLPKQNFEVLDILVKHLTKVAGKRDKNLMTIGNLGVCFGPTLLRPEEETVASIMDLKFYNVVVEILIENYETIFKSKPELNEIHTIANNTIQHNNHFTENAKPVSIQNSSISVNHNRSTTPPLNSIRQHASSISHPQPRYNNFHLPPLPVHYYCDGPNSVNMSSSLHSVPMAYDRETNGSSPYSMMTRSEHSGNVTSSHGSHQQIPSSTLRILQQRIGNSGMSTHSEGNLHTIHNYSTVPHSKNKIPNIVDRVFTQNDISNSTSSSNESVSSDLGINHNHSMNHYSSYSPEKTKRVNPVLYATSYRSQQGNVRVRTLYACLGENDGELSFEPNQIITNVRTSQEPGWLEGTLNGKTGLVPENYVEILP